VRGAAGERGRPVSNLEEAVMWQLSVEAFGEVLMWSGGCGMRRLEADSKRMAAWRFKAFVCPDSGVLCGWGRRR
jgi:hypothetical protein